jgi:uncharacterized membrane protein
MALVGQIGTALSGIFGAWSYAALVAWDAAAATFSVLVWVAVTAMGSSQTAGHARRQDPNPAASDALALAASLVAVGVVLVSASSAHGSEKWELAAGSVALSWILVHTLFTLRYARLYHSAGGGVDWRRRSTLSSAWLAATRLGLSPGPRLRCATAPFGLLLLQAKD